MIREFMSRYQCIPYQKDELDLVYENQHQQDCIRINDLTTTIIERDTECDKCDFLKHCEKSGEVIRCTTSYDEREHFIRGMGAYCRKMNL